MHVDTPVCHTSAVGSGLLHLASYLAQTRLSGIGFEIQLLAACTDTPRTLRPGVLSWPAAETIYLKMV